MFVRWTCGCVGVRIPRAGDVVIKDCRADFDEDLTFCLRAEGIDKDATPLMPHEISALCEEMRVRMREGSAYRDLGRDIGLLLQSAYRKAEVTDAQES